MVTFCSVVRIVLQGTEVRFETCTGSLLWWDWRREEVVSGSPAVAVAGPWGFKINADGKALPEEMCFPHLGCNQQAYSMQSVAETVGR